jgi:methyltransferase (TIGR00027 family)
MGRTSCRTTIRSLTIGTATDPRRAGAIDLYAVVTRFFDDFLLHITADCGVRQVVLVASGLDTRPFRLTWPPRTELFELEQPALLTYKDVQLAHAGAAASACDTRSAWI